MAVSTDVTRGVLGVTGMNYSTLLDRSSDFSRYSPVLYASYPDKVDQQVVFALLQMLWDRAEADGYAHHMTDDPLPGTPRHHILMHVSFGDHQVANVTAEVEARTIGARLRRPALDDGRSPDMVPQWGILPIGHYPYNGSAIVYWDSHMTPAPPIENLPPTAGDDPHEFARSQVEARAQKSAFLRTIGAVIDTCAGLPCPSPS